MRIFIIAIVLNFMLITNIYSSEREEELNKLFIDTQIAGNRTCFQSSPNACFILNEMLIKIRENGEVFEASFPTLHP